MYSHDALNSHCPPRCLVHAWNSFHVLVRLNRIETREVYLTLKLGWTSNNRENFKCWLYKGLWSEICSKFFHFLVGFLNLFSLLIFYRYAMTVWYFDADERAEAKKKFRNLTSMYLIIFFDFWSSQFMTFIEDFCMYSNILCSFSAVAQLHYILTSWWA